MVRGEERETLAADFVLWTRRDASPLAPQLLQSYFSLESNPGGVAASVFISLHLLQLLPSIAVSDLLLLESLKLLGSSRLGTARTRLSASLLPTAKQNSQHRVPHRSVNI